MLIKANSGQSDFLKGNELYQYLVLVLLTEAINAFAEELIESDSYIETSTIVSLIKAQFDYLKQYIRIPYMNIEMDVYSVNSTININIYGKIKMPGDDLFFKYLVAEER